MALNQKRIKAVHYPGLPDNPGYEITKKQTSGFGAMLSLRPTVRKQHQMLERVSLIQYAESLGGVESLITYPILQTHADIPEKDREARGIGNRLLRLSVGLEAADDLIEDLNKALNG